MQISRIIFTTFAVGIIAGASNNSFAQAKSSSMPSISSPAMPTISSPIIGSGFYMPGQTNIYTGRQSYEQKPAAEPQKAQEKATQQKKSSNSLITAKDLTTMSSLGLLGSFSTNPSSLQGQLYSTQTTSETKELLEKVLAQIEEIKTENRETVESTSKKSEFVEPASHNITSVSDLSQKTKSRILRFSVNNYDILRTCSKVYISDVQNDGTFLVTGDRRYTSDGKSRKETFHILFKTSTEECSGSNYTAAAKVTQDYPNEYSFLYELTQRSSLSASRTGNLVSMRTDSDDWKLELLIDLGDAK